MALNQSGSGKRVVLEGRVLARCALKAGAGVSQSGSGKRLNSRGVAEGAAASVNQSGWATAVEPGGLAADPAGSGKSSLKVTQFGGWCRGGGTACVTDEGVIRDAPRDRRGGATAAGTSGAQSRRPVNGLVLQGRAGSGSADKGLGEVRRVSCERLRGIAGGGGGRRRAADIEDNNDAGTEGGLLREEPRVRDRELCCKGRKSRASGTLGLDWTPFSPFVCHIKRTSITVSITLQQRLTFLGATFPPVQFQTLGRCVKKRETKMQRTVRPV